MTQSPLRGSPVPCFKGWTFNTGTVRGTQNHGFQALALPKHLTHRVAGWCHCHIYTCSPPPTKNAEGSILMGGGMSWAYSSQLETTGSLCLKKQMSAVDCRGGDTQPQALGKPGCTPHVQVLLLPQGLVQGQVSWGSVILTLPV